MRNLTVARHCEWYGQRPWRSAVNSRPSGASEASGRCNALVGQRIRSASRQVAKPRQLLRRRSPLSGSLPSDNFEEGAAVWRRSLMARACSVVDVCTGARRAAILHERAREHVHNLVAIVMIYLSHAIARIPLDENGALAGLWIHE